MSLNGSIDVPGIASRELTANQQCVTDNLEQLLEVLPERVRMSLESHPSSELLLEIVLDLGRVPEARFTQMVIELGDEPITDADLKHVIERVGSFGKDNRAGIERTLHRISAIRNRAGRIVGLTCRIGRAVYGTIDIISDVVESGKSILMLGRPGRGKTTKLREVARILSSELHKRVIIVDTSNEIAGDGDIPHPAIGKARRMQVSEPSEQHAVMIEAVENHMPEVIVIDEIGTEQEAFAARTIAERGVQLVGTAHGNSLENLMMNPTLSDLIGGIQAVTLSDEEAKRRGTQKTVLERKAPPTFDVIIEIIEVDKLAIHHNVHEVVDRILRNRQPRPEIRVRTPDGHIEVIQKAEAPASKDGTRPLPEIDEETQPEPPPVVRPIREALRAAQNGFEAKTRKGAIRIFPYGVNRSRLDRAIMESRIPATIARDIQEADVVLALRNSYNSGQIKMREGSNRNLPTYIIKSNTFAQIATAMREMSQVSGLEKGILEMALGEASEGVEQVQETGQIVELAPQNSYTRRLQHQLVERYDMVSDSVGEEPRRRVRILPVS